jgi:hypothetical protein
MPPLHLDRFVTGPYTLKGGRLTFQTSGSLLGSDARQAMTSGRTLTISLTTPEGIRGVTGKVLSVELIKGTPPTAWEIVMKVAT